ncbi:hypothetical protein SOVF_215670, partial [Spinacia oleracea]
MVIYDCDDGQTLLGSSQGEMGSLPSACNTPQLPSGATSTARSEAQHESHEELQPVEEALPMPECEATHEAHLEALHQALQPAQLCAQRDKNAAELQPTHLRAQQEKNAATVLDTPPLDSNIRTQSDS